MAFCTSFPLPCKHLLRLDSQIQKPRRSQHRAVLVRPAASQGYSSAHSPSPQSASVSTDQGENSQPEQEEDFEGLLPEEDWTVRGGANDSLSSNTELGQAVQNACEELETLAGLEQESLEKANELLKKLGYKGNINKPDQ